MSKTTIVVLSDPKGGEEALGRLFNALAAAYDFKSRKHDVAVVFQGTGTRWPALVLAEEHPAHALYRAVEDKVAGVSLACADVFGAAEEAATNGFSLLSDNAVPGTRGLASVAKYASEGSVLIF